MSIRMMALAWDVKLQAHLKLLLLAIADASNDDGEAWPNLKTLSKKTGLSPKRISTNVTTLVEKGFIDRLPRHEPSGRQTSNLYRLKLGGTPPYTRGGTPPSTSTLDPSEGSSVSDPKGSSTRQGEISAPQLESRKDVFKACRGAFLQGFADIGADEVPTIQQMNRLIKQAGADQAAYEKISTLMDRLVASGSLKKMDNPFAFLTACIMGPSGVYKKAQRRKGGDDIVKLGGINKPFADFTDTDWEKFNETQLAEWDDS